MLINYLTGTNEQNPILSFGQPFRVGPLLTGTVFMTSSVPGATLTTNQFYPGVIFSQSRIGGNITGACYLHPVFPGFELPTRFNLEIVPQRTDSNVAIFFLAFGTETTGSNFSGIGFALNQTNRVLLFTTGTISSSTVPVLTNMGIPNNAFGANLITHEIEFKSNVIGTGSNHLTFRDSIQATANPQTNVLFTVLNSRTLFPNIDQFLTATHGQILNRLYFGFTSFSYTDSAETRIENVRIKKHIMDWE